MTNFRKELCSVYFENNSARIIAPPGLNIEHVLSVDISIDAENEPEVLTRFKVNVCANKEEALRNYNS